MADRLADLARATVTKCIHVRSISAAQGACAPCIEKALRALGEAAIDLIPAQARVNVLHNLMVDTVTAFLGHHLTADEYLAQMRRLRAAMEAHA